MPRRIGWATYAAGFSIWVFGYLRAGHAPVFDWEAATPWWMVSFVPNLEAEFGLPLMFASMILIYWQAGRKRNPHRTVWRAADPIQRLTTERREQADRQRALAHRSGHASDWLKFKNPAAPAVKRKAEEEWGRDRWR
jgi:hypothetical protein